MSDECPPKTGGFYLRSETDTAMSVHYLIHIDVMSRHLLKTYKCSKI